MGGIVNVMIVAWTNDVSVVIVPQSEEDPPSKVSSCCRCWGRSLPTTSPHGSTQMVLLMALQITSSCLSPTTMPSIADARRGRDGDVFKETSRASPLCFIFIGSDEAEARWRMPPLWEEKMVSWGDKKNRLGKTVFFWPATFR